MAIEPKKKEKLAGSTGPKEFGKEPTKQPVVKAPEAIDHTPTSVAAEPGNLITGAQ